MDAPPEKKDDLLQPHLNRGELGDRHATKVLEDALPGFTVKKGPLSSEASDSLDAVSYAFRSFDRQFIIPDKRLINRPNPELWKSRSEHQIYLTAPSDRSPSNGPALTFTAFIPDLHHYAGRRGRAFPLWADQDGKFSNFQPNLLGALSKKIGVTITPEDFFAYIAAISANPVYTARFQKDLSTPGLRIPITSSAPLFEEAIQVGRRVLWLYTFGERMADTKQGRPEGPPRLPAGRTRPSRRMAQSPPIHRKCPTRSATTPRSIAC